MFQRQVPQVLVIGAGPVGLFTALLLAERGLKVQIIDEQWRSATRSYGLALHPSSLRLFGLMVIHLIGGFPGIQLGIPGTCRIGHLGDTEG